MFELTVLVHFARLQPICNCSFSGSSKHAFTAHKQLKKLVECSQTSLADTQVCACPSACHWQSLSRPLTVLKDLQDQGAEQDGVLTEGIQLQQQLQEQIEQWKLHRLLSGPYDDGSAVLSIQVTLLPRTAFAGQHALI